jgi:hypothetical protein
VLRLERAVRQLRKCAARRQPVLRCHSGPVSSLRSHACGFRDNAGLRGHLRSQETVFSRAAKQLEEKKQAKRVRVRHAYLRYGKYG